ncbi:50S ribosomal protein L11 methyltransferase [Streptomyces sp. NPDC005805]|uniref:50S ribosomal protein L11 methyltransferase n=1 Tax=Streptomyces sp. NPDC005805 TaxID=3157068 RepID=UPI0033D024F7
MQWEKHATTLAEQATDPGSRWRPLVAAVPRHRFMPRWWHRRAGAWALRDGPSDETAWAQHAYADRSVITRVGPHHADLAAYGGAPAGLPTSSATLPSLVVRMFQHARIADGCELLDIGTGSGYGAALAALRLEEHRVTSIDVDEYLVNAARQRLDRIGLRPQLEVLDGTGVLPGEYDRIVATVAVRRVPPSWLAALRPGGRLVTTISDTTLIVTAEKREDGTAVGQVEWDRAGFMQARAGDDYPDTLPEGLRDAARNRDGDSVTGSDFPALDIQEAWDVAAMLSIEAPGTLYGFDETDGHRVTWLAHPDGSWARASSNGTGPTIVHQSGPRRLWEVLDGIRGYWLTHGELPVRGARVLITPDGRTRLARAGWRATL